MNNQQPPPGYDLPQHARERLAEMRQKRLFTSDLSVSEFLLARDARCEPIAQVMGSSIYHVGQISDYKGATGEITAISDAHRKARWLALRQQALGDGILDAAILGRYEILRPKEYQWQDWLDAQMRKVRGALGALEMEAEAGELAGPLTIGQITIACALGYLDFRYQSEAWRTKHRRLAVWADEIAQRKSIQLTLPKDPA